MAVDEIKMSIRLSPELHERLKRAAERDRRSLHAEMLAFIERCLDADEAKIRKEQRSR